jgi:hypothetical protein
MGVIYISEEAQRRLSKLNPREREAILSGRKVCRATTDWQMHRQVMNDAVKPKSKFELSWFEFEFLPLAKNIENRMNAIEVITGTARHTPPNIVSLLDDPSKPIEEQPTRLLEPEHAEALAAEHRKAIWAAKLQKSIGWPMPPGDDDVGREQGHHLDDPSSQEGGSMNATADACSCGNRGACTCGARRQIAPVNVIDMQMKRLPEFAEINRALVAKEQSEMKKMKTMIDREMRSRYGV